MKHFLLGSLGVFSSVFLILYVKLKAQFILNCLFKHI